MQLYLPRFFPHPGRIFLSVLGLLLAITPPATAAPTAYQTAVLADNPFVYYRFGEAAGTTAIDSSANGFTGTYVAGPTLGVAGDGAGGASDNAVTFNGTSQYVVCPSTTAALAFGTDLGSASYEFVFKTTSTASGYLLGTANTGSTTAINVIMNQNPGGNTTVAGAMRIYIRDSNGHSIEAAFTNATAFDGNYHHLVWTFNAGTLTAYLDGVVQAIGTPVIGTAAPTAFTAFSNPLALACYDSRGTYEDFGAVTLDEAAVYPAALSAVRVTAHYDALTGYTPPPPVVGVAFLPPQSQILSDLVLANNRFTNEWPSPGCTGCLSGNHAS